MGVSYNNSLRKGPSITPIIGRKQKPACLPIDPLGISRPTSEVEILGANRTRPVGLAKRPIAAVIEACLNSEPNIDHCSTVPTHTLSSLLSGIYSCSFYRHTVPGNATEETKLSYKEPKTGLEPKERISCEPVDQSHLLAPIFLIRSLWSFSASVGVFCELIEMYGGRSRLEAMREFPIGKILVPYWSHSYAENTLAKNVIASIRVVLHGKVPLDDSVISSPFFALGGEDETGQKGANNKGPASVVNANGLTDKGMRLGTDKRRRTTL
ncbi:hypothetical protein KQX54_001913 [Cotesia glomerata]|uniref:Uncharacterized protein n=1 Tax=Cotesia glomerata TaxID=32391 RepID=A0AAV7INZ6_COTGL|nr:hypothetical protein KQX54_001913 [Cotesia glomerata]